ncbi:uncharacterized protein LOC132642865 [Lycium barbarum]|uniref:uncharacterized protein LOC132642865 n=1 Tax=Lycium barbarum TaxID=112863 RepID=UPI00293F0B85|nr:uncharacterized protein LOC132642865 [Lycium barbarum]
MATFIKVLGLVLCLALMCEGIESLGCDSDIVINQAKLGIIKGQQVWNATLTNTCACTLLDMKLSIPNFNYVIKINTTIISKSHDDIYDVNGGQPIYSNSGIFFTYVGKSLDVIINDYTEACS